MLLMLFGKNWYESNISVRFSDKSIKPNLLFTEDSHGKYLLWFVPVTDFSGYLYFGCFWTIDINAILVPALCKNHFQK